MDLLEKHCDDYLAWLYRQSGTIVKRDPSALYYDYTNFYFECGQADDEIVDEVMTGLLPPLRSKICKILTGMIRISLDFITIPHIKSSMRTRRSTWGFTRMWF